VEVLGKQFSSEFERFLTDAKAELGRSVEFVETGAAGAAGSSPAPESGEGTVRIVVDPALPDSACELAAARQLAAELLRTREYPEAGPLGHGVALERQGDRAAAVQRLMDVLAGDALLREAGIDTAALAEHNGAGQEHPLPDGAIRPARGTDEYLYLQLGLVQQLLLADAARRGEIERVYRTRVPGIVGDVKGAVTRVAKIGWDTPERAGRSLAVIILMLGLHDQLVVIDPKTRGVMGVTARTTDDSVEESQPQSPA
jgi:hypothetical protein